MPKKSIRILMSHIPLNILNGKDKFKYEGVNPLVCCVMSNSMECLEVLLSIFGANQFTLLCNIPDEFGLLPLPCLLYILRYKLRGVIFSESYEKHDDDNIDGGDNDDDGAALPELVLQSALLSENHKEYSDDVFNTFAKSEYEWSPNCMPENCEICDPVEMNHARELAG